MYLILWHKRDSGDQRVISASSGCWLNVGSMLAHCLDDGPTLCQRSMFVVSFCGGFYHFSYTSFLLQIWQQRSGGSKGGIWRGVKPPFPPQKNIITLFRGFLMIWWYTEWETVPNMPLIAWENLWKTEIFPVAAPRPLYSKIFFSSNFTPPLPHWKTRSTPETRSKDYTK